MHLKWPPILQYIKDVNTSTMMDKISEHFHLSVGCFSVICSTSSMVLLSLLPVLH